MTTIKVLLLSDSAALRHQFVDVLQMEGFTPEIGTFCDWRRYFKDHFHLVVYHSEAATDESIDLLLTCVTNRIPCIALYNHEPNPEFPSLEHLPRVIVIPFPFSLTRFLSTVHTLLAKS